MVNDIGEIHVALVSAGLVPFAQDMGCSPVTFLAAFKSEASRQPTITTTTPISCGRIVEKYSVVMSGSIA